MVRSAAGRRACRCSGPGSDPAVTGDSEPTAPPCERSDAPSTPARPGRCPLPHYVVVRPAFGLTRRPSRIGNLVTAPDGSWGLRHGHRLFTDVCWPVPAAATPPRRAAAWEAEGRRLAVNKARRSGERHRVSSCPVRKRAVWALSRLGPFCRAWPGRLRVRGIAHRRDAVRRLAAAAAGTVTVRLQRFP